MHIPLFIPFVLGCGPLDAEAGGRYFACSSDRTSQIQVDVVNYVYPWMREVVLEDGLRLASVDDIAAMTIALTVKAVVGR